MPTARRNWLLPFLLYTLGVAGCASAPAPGGSDGAGRPNGDVITQQELQDPALSGSSVYNAVRKLRPRFLNERGAGFQAESQVVSVSVNGSALMPVRELETMDVSTVTEIKYLSTAEASMRFGLSGNMGPVLLVSVKVGPH